MSYQRGRLWVLWMVLCGIGLSSCGGGSGDSGGFLSPGNSSSVTLNNGFAQLPAFTKPVAALQAPADNTHWYVVEQGGHVRVFDNVSSVSSSSDALDISARIYSPSGSEMGLLGMAFHPDFPADSRVFLSYTASVSGQTVSRISSFNSTDGGVTFDPTSEIVLLTVNQPAGETNHKGGSLAFGSDRYLYIGFGDGGGAGDVHGAIGNAQSLNTLLGKILRIDVGVVTSTAYTIPASNPYLANPICGTSLAGSSTQPCPEIYAYGFRNPWRFSFDRQNDNFWVGDVGQAAWEEIDWVSKGGNYGWRCKEGNHDYNMSGCTGTYIAPIAEYSHAQGDDAVVGGYVYRGTVSTKMQGQYIFGDEVSGRIWAMPTGTGAGSFTQLIDSSYSISSFAQANDGELYAIDYNSGKLFKLVF